MTKACPSHLHSVGWSRRCNEGLCCCHRTYRLGLFQQAQLVCDVGHLFLQAFRFDGDLRDFLSGRCRQKGLFEVHQVKGPLLLQAHQSAELIELAVHVGLELLRRHLRYVDETEGSVCEGIDWGNLSAGCPQVTKLERDWAAFENNMNELRQCRFEILR